MIGEMDVQKIDGQPRTSAPQKPKRVQQDGKIYELDETTNAYIEVAQ